MSNQSAKKKRIGSRRRVANPSKTSEADEFQITDSTSIAQCHIPEENTESFNVLANPDSAQSETQNPPSPELVGNRRKLGSSRRNKGGQHVKDSATESYYKPREEVEGKTRGYENPETTQISLAIQPERQEELSQGSEHDIMSATHDSSLYSATTPDYSSEVQSYTTTNCPEAGLESLIPKSETDCKVASDSCKLEETMLGGIDKYDTLQSEEVKQNAHLAAISELTSLTVLSYPREDEQLIDQSDFREMPEEELLNVYSVTEKDSKERDEDTEFLMPDGNLQGNYVVSESHVESVIHFSTTPEIHTDKSSPREDTETECRVEQAEFSSSKEDSTNEEQNEIFNLSEVRGGHRSEDVVNTLRGKEVKQTEMQEIDHSSESVTHDATQNSEIITGNLMDQAEVTVKSTDDSVTNQEDSNPGDKQDEHPTKENNFEALDHKNEDDHVYDTKEPQINDIEREDTALDLVYEGEDQVEHDIKPSAEQTVHQEKEGSLSEDDKSESSLQTLQSETNAPLDSDPQQTNTGFNPIGNRRKMGSSRRNKGRPQVKESVTEAYHEHKEEVVESTRGNEPFETTQMLLAIERTSQEELSQGSEHDIIMPATHDNSLYSAFIPGYSSEVQNPSTTNYPEADLESLIPKSENIREDRDERETDFKVEVSDKSVGATLEGMDKSDTLQSQEVRGAHHSEDAVNIVHEQEVQPTQSQEIDYSSESVAPDATEDSEINSGNLMDQAEVSDTYQSDVTVESTDDSVTNQEDSNLGNKQDEGPTKENNFEALDHKNEDHHVYNTKEPWISDIEGEDTALDLVYEGEGQVEHDIKPSPEQTVHQEKEGSLSEDDKSESSLQTLQSETNAPLDSEPQQTNTGFNPIGNRRKMGSSRRNKGRQQVKESVTEAYHEHKEEVVESTRGNEPLETTQMLLAMERTSQEELSQGSEHDIIMPATHDNSLYSAFIPGYSSEVQNPTTTNYPEADLESLIPKSENIREDRDERETDFKVEVSDKSVGATLEGMDKSDTLQSQEVRGAHHSEDAVNKVHEQEVQPTQSQEIDYSSESVAPDATEDSEINSGNLMDQAEVIDTYQSDVTVESTDDSVTNQEDSNLGDKQDEDPTKENNFEALDHKNEDHHVYNAKEPWINDIEREDTALDLVYEGEGQVEHDIKPSAEQTVHQEKEGSLSEDDKSKSSLQTLQSETNAPLDSDPQQTNTGFNPIGNRRKMGSSRRHKGRQQVKESVTEAYHEHKEEVVESTRGNEPLETTQMLLEIERTSQEELSQGSEHDIIMPATHDNSLYSAFIPGYSSEVQNPTTTNYPEADLESLIPKSENIREDRDERETDFKVEVSDKSVGATLEGMDKSDTLQSQEVRGAHHSEDAVNKLHEQEVQPTQTQEIDYSSESVAPDATEDSEINSGNLMDQAEVSDTYQSEVIVESTDDSVTNQEDSNPGDKQDEHPTKENNFEALDHRNEDDHVYDTKEPRINDIEREDTALDLVYEGEGQVEHDIKPSAEQTVHQEEEGILSEDDKSESSLQTLQSETNAPLDSDPQQTNTGFNPIGNRRKMGSSRRHKGRQQVKESVTEAYHEHKDEVVESTRGNEPLETTQMLLAIERTSQEELSQGSEHDIIMPATHDNSLYSAFIPGYSSDVQNPTTTNYPEVDLESLIPESENIREDRDERETDFKVEVSDKSVGATLEGMDKSDTLQSQEVRGAHHSEDAVNKVHEQEVQPTQMQEIDYSSESVTPDATEDSEINSGNLMDQAEVSDTYQSEVTVESTDDSVTNQEDSNPGDKQDEHPTKENSFEALDHRNEDDHVYDTKEPRINDIEREDTALDLVYEGEGQVEHDIKPSAEQTVHQEKEGSLSEDDKSESSLQTLQSETNAPLDSDPQQTNTGFNPIGNRRKMGSSRRNKGRQQVKESVTEAYHEHKEEVVESTRGNEPLETTQMLLAIERTSQEELSQGSEHDIIMPATHDNSLYSAFIPGYSSEVQNPTTTNYPEVDLESLIPKSENIREDRDERETDFKVEVSDKSVGATLEGMDKSDTLQSQEVRGAHHSEDVVNIVHEQEVQPTQTQEIDYSSESVTPDATEDSEINSGNLMDQVEVSDTYQSEVIVESTDDSVTNQEDSNPGDKQEEHPTKENNFEALDHRNEDDHVYDTKEPQINDIEREDTALDPVYEGEGLVEHDIKPSVEQTVHQEKEGILSEDDKSESSLQTLQSETNAPLDSDPQQTNTGFNPIGNRRKMGSSRRNKGRQQVKESVTEAYHEHKEEVVESTRGNEPLETTQMLLAIERTSQEELSQGSEHDIIMPATHDNSLYSAFMPGYSSEVQNPTTTNYPEVDLESLIPKSENIREDRDERETDFRVEVSDKSVGATLEGIDKSDTLQSQEVRGAHHSEDAVNKVHEQEVQPTQTQEIDYSSESVAPDTTEDSEINSGNLMDQAEVSDTYQSEVTVESTDDSVTNQEDSNPGDKQDEHPTKENNFEALDHRNEDDHVYDTKEPQINDIEREDTALDLVYEGKGQVEHDIKPSAEQTVHQEKEGILSEDDKSESSLQALQSETDAPLDSDPQQTNTGFNAIGNRRKMGSSRRNKGRQQVKESVTEAYHEHKEEVVESTRGNEHLETTQMLLAIERTSQEELSQGSEHDIIMPATHDSSLYSAVMPGYSSEVHNTTTRNYPEADLESLIPKSENIREDRDERETDFKVEVSDKSVGATLEGRVERDIKPSAEQTVHQEKEGILSEDDKSESSFQTLQSETNAPLDSERQPTNTCFNPIGNRRKMGSSRRNRGRQHVKDSVAESYHRPTEEVLGNPRDNEPLETTKMSLTAETEEQEDSMETTLEGIDTFDTHQTVEVSDQVKENANVGTLVGISELNYSTLHPSPTFDHETMDQSNFREMPEELPNVYSLTEKESKERDEHTALLRPDVNYLMSESHLKLENIESSITPEISTEKNSPGEHTEIECTVEQAAFSSQKEKSSTNEEQKEHVNLSQVRGAQHSEDAVDEVHGEEVKPRHMQEMHQIDFPSIMESESSLQTLQSEMNAPLDSQTLGDSQNIKQQTHTGFNPTGNRRKMGSSRRNKGRQHARDSVTESYHRSTEEVLGNTRDNESLETTKAEPEKSMETTLEGMDTYVTRHTEEVSDQVKESAHVGTLVGISELNCSTLHPSPTVDQEMMDQSNFREMPEELPNVYSLTEKESKERDEHTELLRPDVNLHEEEVKPTHMQEMHQTNFPSITESESSLQTLQSEMNAPLDSQTPDDSQSIKQQTHTGFNPAGGRRKMGSSRRNKGRQHVSFAETYHEPKKEFEENMRGDEALETTKMLLATETLRQEELQEQTALYFKPAERIRKIRSTVYDEEDTEKMSTEDVNEVEKKLIKQPENLSQLTGDGSVKMDSTQVSVWKDSDLQNMSYHDDNVSARPGQLQVSGQDEVGEEFGDPTKKDPEAQEKNVSHVITHTELFSAADNITDTLAHIGLEENLKAESAVDVPEESGISSQQGIQEKTYLDDSENLQGKSKQKRRKMGSTRRTQLNRKPEGGMDIKDETKDSDFHMEADMRNLDKMEVVEELPMIVTAEVSQNEDAKPSMSVVYKEKQETNDTSAVHDKGQKLQSSTEEVVNPIKFVQVADVRDGERNVDISLEPSHLDDFTSTEMHITSVLAGRNNASVNPLQSSNTEDASDTGITCETTQSTQNDEEKPESVNAIQDQALKSAAPVAAVADLEILKSVVRGGGGEEYKNAQARIQEPNNMNEGAHDKDLEMKSASPNLNSTSRRRKMGSTRRNLGSRTKGEDLHQKPEVDNEAAETVTHIGDVKTENFSGIKEKELQLEDKDSDSEQRKEKVFETVEYSYTGESHVKPPAHQAFEENPVLHGQQVETEHQITPAIPSTSPTHDVMSESVSGGRRRKMGSHRKSRGHQNNENQTARGDRVTDTQNGGDVRSIPDESAIKTSEKESLGLDKISEVDESDKKESSNISFSKAEEHSRPASEKTPEPVTPVQHRYAEIRLSQESQKTFSLAGSSRGADFRSNSYNVMMVGDSSVGKTSFMKRAQSGKFSLDLPASVGLDSCVWTVVLDGKPVVLQLWDTAGQERFHSITRQIFHKAQAFLLMYDITSSQSFSAVSYWASCIQEGAAENVTTVLVGNKSDHAKRQVKTQEGEILAKDYNFEFTECSAATGENVIQCLETVARMLSQKVDKREEALVLRKEPQPKKSSGCC